MPVAVGTVGLRGNELTAVSRHRCCVPQDSWRRMEPRMSSCSESAQSWTSTASRSGVRRRAWRANRRVLPSDLTLSYRVGRFAQPLCYALP